MTDVASLKTYLESAGHDPSNIDVVSLWEKLVEISTYGSRGDQKKLDELRREVNEIMRPLFKASLVEKIVKEMGETPMSRLRESILGVILAKKWQGVGGNDPQIAAGDKHWKA